MPRILDLRTQRKTAMHGVAMLRNATVLFDLPTRNGQALARRLNAFERGSLHDARSHDIPTDVGVRGRNLFVRATRMHFKGAGRNQHSVDVRLLIDNALRRGVIEPGGRLWLHSGDQPMWDCCDIQAASSGNAITGQTKMYLGTTAQRARTALRDGIEATPGHPSTIAATPFVAATHAALARRDARKRGEEGQAAVILAVSTDIEATGPRQTSDFMRELERHRARSATTPYHEAFPSRGADWTACLGHTGAIDITTCIAAKDLRVTSWQVRSGKLVAGSDEP